MLTELRGYTLDRPEPLVVEVAPGDSQEVVVLRRDGPAPAAYRYLSMWQDPYRIACATGVCVRGSQSRGGSTVDLHNRLSIPVVAEIDLGGTRMPPLRLEPGEVRTMSRRGPGQRGPAFQFVAARAAVPPDTTVVYGWPLRGSTAHVRVSGMSASREAAYARDTSAFGQAAFLQNRPSLTMTADTGAAVVAMRRGVVLAVEDTTAWQPPSPLPPPTEAERAAARERGERILRGRVRRVVLNHVFVRHDDGTMARYVGLARGSVPVRVGDVVEAGTVLGRLDGAGALGVSVSEMGPEQASLPVTFRRPDGRVGPLRVDERVGF